MIDIKMAYYRKKDWNRFIRIIDDPESMHDSWEEWLESVENAKREFKKMGMEMTYVTIDLDELAIWCRKQGLRNDGNARARFVQEYKSQDRD